MTKKSRNSAVSNWSQRLPSLLFIFSLLMACFFWGVATYAKKIWPYKFLMEAAVGLTQTSYNTGLFRQWFYQDTDQKQPLAVAVPELAQAGLTKLVMVDADKQLAVKIVDLQGELVHKWRINWFELWPEPSHLQSIDVPKSAPGTHIHGALVQENGDLVFNFEHLGMMRIDACGKPVWRLPYQTHHSIDQDSEGNFWVAAQKNHYDDDPQRPNFEAPFVEAMVIKVSPDGQLLREFSVFDVLEDNGLTGLLHMSSTDNWDISSSEDVVHLNDVEVFKADMPAGVFTPGDIMLSLRNINAIIVLEPVNLKAKYVTVGGVVRQHDPDFLDGNEISIYDNNNLGVPGSGHYSKIVIEDARTREQRIAYGGSKQQAFYSQIMGKHQWLANGNLLVAESMRGRAFEVRPDGNIVWDYYNIIGAGLVGIIEGAERLAPNFDKALFTKLNQQCRQ